ncbi:MAG TPA: hypothetical protein DGF30_11715 [Desulfomicrobium sp.]|nr:hypothetical protein [Desulfomicrobium sp.]
MKGNDKDKRAAADVSLDQVRDMIWEALQERDKDAYVSEVYPSYIVASKDGQYFRLAWSMMDGKVTLGEEMTPVERVWVEVRSAQAEPEEGVDLLMRLGSARDPEGMSWEVLIAEPGFTRNGWYLPETVLRGSAGLFENVDVNLFELPQGVTHVPAEIFDIKSFLVKNKCGWIDGVRYAAGEGLKGTLHFLEESKWLGKNLLAAQQSGRSIYGLSYDCAVRAAQDTVAGKSVMVMSEIKKADSVDIVSRPAAGGKFLRAVASVPAHTNHEEAAMKEKLWKIISEKRPDLLQGKTLEGTPDAEVETLARMAMDPNPPATPPSDEVKILRCEMAVKDALAESGLPDLSRERIRKQFAGRVFETEELTRAIADEKDYLAKIAAPAAPAPIPGSGISAGIDSFDKATMAVDRMFGLTRDNVVALSRMDRLDHRPVFEDLRAVADFGGYDAVPAFAGLREAYVFFTGDSEVRGILNRRAIPKDILSRMDIDSATFTYVLGNTLNRRLVKEYMEADFGEALLISVRKAVKDFRTQEAVLVGGFPDIATVDPEAADYAEIAGVTDEESSYTVGQKGNLLTITRKAIINDDISVVQRLVTKLGRATRRTHAKYVWAFFTGNANCSDGTAWFTGGHGNLGATALSHATALVAYKALANMTEKDSGEPLGLLDGFNVKPVLVTPVALFDTGEKIATEDFYYTANDLTTKLPNPLKGKVIAKMISLLTDATDWGLLLPPEVADMVEMGYLNGRQEPEFFLNDSPQGEQVFVADKIRYKVRHEYGGAVVDFRSGYKAVVAG